MNKKKVFVFFSALFCVLSCIAVSIVLYAVSPYHPKNITDETVIQKGTEYILSVSGVSDYDEKGFVPVADGFYFPGRDKVFIYRDENGIARTSRDENGECYILGEYSSSFIAYESYSFCGERFRDKQELEAFFDEPERIYDFDLDKIAEYVQDIINYKRHFFGNVKVKIYRGRLVITEFYVEGEKVLEYKR